MNIRSKLELAAAVATVLVLAMSAPAADELPDPDGKPADMSQPVQVYILLGQSNMLGFGRVGPPEQQGTLHNLIQAGHYEHLVDDEGEWTL